MDDHAAVVSFSYLLATYLLSVVLCLYEFARQSANDDLLSFSWREITFGKVRHENRRKDPLWWLVVEEKDGER
jgi:hypothetical protein